MPRPGGGNMGLSKHRKSGWPNKSGLNLMRLRMETNKDLDKNATLRRGQKPDLTSDISHLFDDERQRRKQKGLGKMVPQNK